MNEDPYSRFSLATFESLDVEDDDRAAVDELTGELERLAAERMGERPGWDGVEELISALNRHGHRFERRKTDEGWASYFQETNDGTRDFWIHANREEELISVHILYFEKMGVTKAREREEMTDEERAGAALVDAFYDRGLELTERSDDYDSLPDRDRLHLALYLLETGVQNGGFHTYIANTEGAHLADAADFLGIVGARELEAVVRDVLRLFPSGFAHGLTDEMQAALDDHRDALDALDARFYDSNDHLAKLVMTYLETGRPADSP